MTDSLHMEKPGLRGVYADGSAATCPAKAAGGAESPKPDTELPRGSRTAVSNLRSFRPETPN